ncbi:MAG: 4Fe-4S binding protein [bacterium]
MSIVRKIIKIDEEKCDGCGLCVQGCPEGAIQIIDGKARLVRESYCDGLGACLGECPQGAITIEERTAEEFDEKAVQAHLAGRTEKPERPVTAAPVQSETPGFRCPGAMSRVLRPAGEVQNIAGTKPSPSMLGNWPVQLHLVPIHAPYLQGARILIAADCAPFAYADFHRRFLAGRTLLVGCPKLDNTDLYLSKLTELFRQNDIQSVEVVYMEVPCCHGLVRLVNHAMEQSGKTIPVHLAKISVDGTLLRTEGPHRDGDHKEIGARQPIGTDSPRMPVETV